MEERKLKVDVFYGKEKIAQFDSLSELDEHEQDVLPKKEDGWDFVEGRSCGSNGYSIYFNKKKMDCIVYSWKENSGFFDRNGEPIYIGDVCKDTNTSYCHTITTCWSKTRVFFRNEVIKAKDAINSLIIIEKVPF